MPTHLSLQDLVYGSSDADNLPTMASKINQNNADTTNAINTHASNTTEEHGVGSAEGNIVGTSKIQTLTNKTIDGSSNSLSNIDDGSLNQITTPNKVAAASVEDKFLRNDGDDISTGKITAEGLDANNNKITSVSDPDSGTDVANMRYVDSSHSIAMRQWVNDNYDSSNQLFSLEIPLVVSDEDNGPSSTVVGEVYPVAEFDPDEEQIVRHLFRLYPYQGGNIRLKIYYSASGASSGIFDIEAVYSSRKEDESPLSSPDATVSGYVTPGSNTNLHIETPLELSSSDLESGDIVGIRIKIRNWSGGSQHGYNMRVFHMWLEEY